MNANEIYNKNMVITRFAPSPTGLLHVGSARTALFNYLYAKKSGGIFILRIEDTDRERSKKEYEDDILEGLLWLGLSYDAFYKQSERTQIYRTYLQKIINDGFAYEAEENKDGSGRVVRFRNTNETITFKDLVRGDISFNTTELGDFVIAKNTETPLYHFAVVVDDFEMNISHVIRGEDGISNTPRQILIGRAIGATEPKYAHIPLILAPDRSKLSKRHGAVSVNEYRKEGYLPEAVNNFLALMGWNPGDNREIFYMNELVKEFDLNKIQKSGAVFNREKLDWINKEHIRIYPKEKAWQEIENRLKNIPDEMKKKLAPAVLERISKWGDVEKMATEGEFDYFSASPQYEATQLVWKESSTKDTLEYIDELIRLLQKSNFSSMENIKESLWSYVEKAGKGNVLWPMRYALSGRDKSPDPFILAYILGREETIKRLHAAKEKISGF